MLTFLAVALEWQQHGSSFTACDKNRTVRCRSSSDHFHSHHLTADGTCDEKWLTRDPFADSLDKNMEKRLVWVRRGVSVWFKDPDIFYNHVQNDTNAHWTAVTRTNRPIPGMSTCSDGLSATKRPLLKHRRAFMSHPELISCCWTRAAEGVQEEADITPRCVDLCARVGPRRQLGLRLQPEKRLELEASSDEEYSHTHVPSAHRQTQNTNMDSSAAHTCRQQGRA